MKINHLRNHYSNYVFMFIKKYIDQLNTSMKVFDAGAGHFRNLKLFQELGFNNLYALDIEDTDNPLEVNLKDFVINDIEEGIPYEDREFDIVLCNYLLMFINQNKINAVIDDLLRVTGKFIVIETNKQKVNSKETSFKQYSFNYIVSQIEKNKDFEILQVRKYYEKIIARRVS